MKRIATIGGATAGILAVVVGLLFWPHFRLSTLTSLELKLNHANPKPPAQPVIFTESYGDMPKRLCGNLEPLIDTNICDVVRLPDLFADKCIRVAGRFETDGLEYSVILDESCSDRGLVPWTTRQTEEKPSVVELDEAIKRYGHVGTRDMQITGRFTGRFVWRPSEGREPLILEINSVSNLKVKNVPQR